MKCAVVDAVSVPAHLLDEGRMAQDVAVVEVPNRCQWRGLCAPLVMKQNGRRQETSRCNEKDLLPMPFTQAPHPTVGEVRSDVKVTC